MAIRSRALTLHLGLASLLLAGSLTEPTPAHAEGSDPVLLTVGKVTLTQSEVTRRIGRLPAFQLARYGSNPTEIKKLFIERVLVPELLLSQHAADAKLSTRPGIARRLRNARNQVMLDGLREELEKSGPVSEARVAAYYKEHQARFNTPERIKIWRLQLGSESEAKKLMATLRGTVNPKKWRELVREKSIDKATAMRDGSLGFVLPDGRTNMPRVKVDAALYAAAQGVENGQLVPQPVKEGERWAIVWRRGSVPAATRTIDSERLTIQRLLRQKELQERLDSLYADLEKKHVSQKHPELIDQLSISERPGLRRRTATKQRPAAGSAKPAAPKMR